MTAILTRVKMEEPVLILSMDISVLVSLVTMDPLVNLVSENQHFYDK